MNKTTKKKKRENFEVKELLLDGKEANWQLKV
jgi:hypothetical protein